MERGVGQTGGGNAFMEHPIPAIKAAPASGECDECSNYRGREGGFKTIDRNNPTFLEFPLVSVAPPTLAHKYVP